MRMYPFSDDDAVEAVLRGEVPPTRQDLAPLAEVVAGLRATSSGTPPQPSAALADLLDHGLVGQGLSIDKGDLPATAASNASRPARQVFGLPKWRKNMIVEWIAGLGLAVKLGVGATVAAASVTGAGVAGALPGPAQGAFQSVVNTATPFTVGDDTSRDAEKAAEKAAAEADRAKDAEEKVREDAEKAQQQAEDEAAKAADEAEDAEEKVRDDAADAADDARDAEEQAREDAVDAEEKAAEGARDAEERAREQSDRAEEQAAEDARDAEEKNREDAGKARDRGEDRGSRTDDGSGDDN
ncbi:MAG TPA: hypothetical protein VGO94_10900 [Mycobacteriales bacterium]|jgi:chemotaxis protein histidine kinase CheA|nr:hypothetical protein [Mycobacteriales bacterium]